MLKIFPTIAELNRFAAEKFVETANDSIEKRGRFAVALAGGSTPKSLYRLLSGDKFKDKINWGKVCFFFGDERNVLPDAPESNFRMANENLFKPLQINENNIFRWKTELRNAEEIARDYEKKLRTFFHPDIYPRNAAKGSDSFDLILLGMGADGHTASLFPFTDALKIAEGEGWVKIAVANPVEKLNATRLTLTFPIINNAKNVIFLVAGAEKAETLREVLEGDFAPEKLPSQNVKPKDGNLFWLLDKNVAKLLTTYGN